MTQRQNLSGARERKKEKKEKRNKGNKLWKRRDPPLMSYTDVARNFFTAITKLPLTH